MDAFPGKFKLNETTIFKADWNASKSFGKEEVLPDGCVTFTATSEKTIFAISLIGMEAPAPDTTISVAVKVILPRDASGNEVSPAATRLTSIVFCADSVAAKAAIASKIIFLFIILLCKNTKTTSPKNRDMLFNQFFRLLNTSLSILID